MSSLASGHPPTGYPPTGVASAGDLTAAQVRDRLTGDEAAETLDRLSITGADRDDLARLIPRAVRDETILDEVTHCANLLRAEAGLHAASAPLGELAGRHNTLQQCIAPGEGLIPILAHIVATDTVRAWHAARGLTGEESWRVLADLGQQLRVHGAGTGVLGLHQLGWTALNWAGRLVHLGRLQFDLHRWDDGDRERWVIGTHIPASGPLDPAAVEAGFAAASEFFPSRFPDLARGRPPGVPPFGREFVCRSWMINAELPRALGSGSNLGAFVERWEILSTWPDPDGAAFFVFDVRPPYDPAALPRRTRLERLVGGRLADGRGWESGLGVLVR